MMNLTDCAWINGEIISCYNIEQYFAEIVSSWFYKEVVLLGARWSKKLE